MRVQQLDLALEDERRAQVVRERGVQALALLGRAPQRALRFGQARMASNDEARWPSSSSRSYDTELEVLLGDVGRCSVDTSNPGWRRLPKKRRAAAMHRPNHSGNMRNVSSSSAEDGACASSDGGVFT